MLTPAAYAHACSAHPHAAQASTPPRMGTCTQLNMHQSVPACRSSHSTHTHTHSPLAPKSPFLPARDSAHTYTHARTHTPLSSLKAPHPTHPGRGRVSHPVDAGPLQHLPCQDCAQKARQLRPAQPKHGAVRQHQRQPQLVVALQAHKHKQLRGLAFTGEGVQARSSKRTRVRRCVFVWVPVFTMGCVPRHLCSFVWLCCSTCAALCGHSSARTQPCPLSFAPAEAHRGSTCRCPPRKAAPHTRYSASAARSLTLSRQCHM